MRRAGGSSPPRARRRFAARRRGRQPVRGPQPPRARRGRDEHAPAAAPAAPCRFSPSARSGGCRRGRAPPRPPRRVGGGRCATAELGRDPRRVRRDGVAIARGFNDEPTLRALEVDLEGIVDDYARALAARGVASAHGPDETAGLPFAEIHGALPRESRRARGSRVSDLPTFFRREVHARERARGTFGFVQHSGVKALARCLLDAEQRSCIRCTCCAASARPVTGGRDGGLASGRRIYVLLVLERDDDARADGRVRGVHCEHVGLGRGHAEVGWARPARVAPRERTPR